MGEKLFMTDRFPEAFKRFEEDVDVSRFESFRQLEFAFGRWAGQKWVPTYRQLDALRYEARRIEALKDGYRRRNAIYFPYSPNVSCRHETVSVRGRIQHRYRDIRTGRFVKKR
jgi:hypothetical protein